MTVINLASSKPVSLDDFKKNSFSFGSILVKFNDIIDLIIKYRGTDMKSKQIMLILFLLVASVSFTYSATIEKIVARINGKIITQSELDEFTNMVNNSGSARSINKKQALKELIQLQIIFQLAEELSLEVHERDLDLELKKIQKSFGAVTTEAFEIALKKQKKGGISFLRFSLKVQMTQQKLIRHIYSNQMVEQPEESLIKKKYKEHEQRFVEKEKVQIAQILIHLSKDEPLSEINKKQQEAKRILKLIRSKKKDFGLMAQHYSTDSITRKRGGLMGFYDKSTLNRMHKGMGDTAFKLKKGQVSDLIMTDKGIHIIKVLKRKSGRKVPYAKAKSNIRNSIIHQLCLKQLNSMILAKRKRSDIEIYK